MKIRRFNPTDNLIIVQAQLYGPRGDRPLSLAFDTAASETHVVPEILDDLGYSPRQGEAITSVRSAIGKEPGYILRVTRFASLGFSFPDFAVHVHDLPEGVGIDGLLGLSFLRHFNYEVRSQEGRILVDRAAAR
jgi:hypothetical protein